METPKKIPCAEPDSTHFFPQVEAQSVKPNITITTTPSKGGGLMVLPSFILSLILPAGVLASLLHELHCWTSHAGETSEVQMDRATPKERPFLNSWVEVEKEAWPARNLSFKRLNECLEEAVSTATKALQKRRSLEASYPDAQEVGLSWLRQIN